ncbi:hypothetical protein SAMN05216456_0174 [Devosia crocina]|uniref:Uncharacterized protein n=1 Tax=Devosia crocina TaxID=429728 RepID=A0A1I7MXB6_9HYPH|nr:hypothetical protein [Devosia crocina]SFV27005.1 hypothetical protein SAMN05216456_0174 [Devosia crocina]
MLWNLLVFTTLVMALGIAALVYALRLAGVEDGIPLKAPVSDAPLDRAFREEPVQTFMWQVQVARYWKPPFRRR